MGSRRFHAVLAVLTACSYAEPPDVLPPVFAAIHPSFASAGDTIMLEGTFSEAAMVEFPGGATQRATIHGAHRASVVVPDRAADGGLFVTTSNTRLGPIAFGRTVSGPRLQPFQAGPSLVRDRLAASAVVVGSKLYVLGGLSGNGPLDSIERAEILADGTLGPFEEMPRALTMPRYRHAAVTAGDGYYLLGGYGAQVTSSVEGARMSPVDGSLDSFEAAGSLVQMRRGPASEIIGNRLYVFGGDPVSVEYAPLGGPALDFLVVSGLGVRPDNPGATARIAATSAVFESSICLFGGSDQGGTMADSIACASISPDGSLGEFTPGASFDAYAGSAGVAVGRHMYLLGGYDGAAPSNRVVRIPIDGARSQIVEPSLEISRFDAMAVVVRSSICVIGGQGPPGAGRSVECAAFATP